MELVRAGKSGEGRGADGAGMECPATRTVVCVSGSASMPPALGRYMHAARGVLCIACAVRAAVRRAGTQAPGGSEAVVPVRQYKLADNRHFKAPRIFCWRLATPTVRQPDGDCDAACHGIGKSWASRDETVVPQGFPVCMSRLPVDSPAQKPGFCRASLPLGNARGMSRSGWRDQWIKALRGEPCATKRNHGVSSAKSMSLRGRHCAIPPAIGGLDGFPWKKPGAGVALMDEGITVQVSVSG
ncbi:hypothetical protein LMG31506_02223 [Cupriavidus yeoncheonensis]|uniref:Uncharacterized protein n=1 Tax=Cupriavidus yeoncheonensis TaxID=1462994 RepID=A0A916N3C3_9BURK|nr:hypothetical protein LMG31506_02223 [Cupriavidus yeoncheonensis]